MSGLRAACPAPACRLLAGHSELHDIPSGIAWDDRDDAAHPVGDHYCRCSCRGAVKLACPEHGWMYAPPKDRDRMRSRAALLSLQAQHRAAAAGDPS